MATFGYARVSSGGQSLAAQDTQLREAGCAKVYAEKISGSASASARPELNRLLGRLQEGDVLVVCRLDRMSRSVRDLLGVLDQLAQGGVGFKSLAEPWADTTSAIGKLVTVVLSGVAEFERSLIRSRTGEGRKRAQERGVRFGRPFSMNQHQRREALERLRAGESQASVARSYAVSAATISRLSAS